MINIEKKESCCGCCNCLNICPTNAITMVEDELGFKYSKVDKSKCINCGLCKKVCPIVQSKKEVQQEIKCYAAYNKNEEDRLNSSSGGIFILLAKYIISQGGVVIGASFNENFEVNHICIDNLKDLEKLMKSKYTQSYMGSIYKETKELLDKNKYVLFTGTPCQIEGLKIYLRKDYDKLYLQDIICHGVPSPKLWKKYIEDRKKIDNDEIKSINFRNKDNGWLNYNIKFKYRNKDYKNNISKDPYMKLFLSNIALRESCYNCHFKKIHRVSDITLADFWGIDKIDKTMFDNKGTSLIIISSKKGQKLFNIIKDDLICKEENINDALKYNPSMTKSSAPHPKKQKFLDDIDKLTVQELSNKYIHKRNILLRVVGRIKRILKNN